MPTPSVSGREAGLPFVVRVALCAVLAVLVLTACTYLDFRQPFIGYGFGGAFLFFIATGSSRKRMAALAAAGVLLSAWVVWGRYQDPATMLVQVIGAFGLASLLILACTVLWNGANREPAAHRALLPAMALTFMVLAAKYSLNMASLLHGKTLDAYAFAFDGAYGEPSFILGRVVDSNSWLFPFVKITYEGILLAMAAFYAGFMRRRSKPIWEIIELLFASAMIGYAFFSIFPVCGPRYAFGRDFPGLVVPFAAFHQWRLTKIPVPPMFPRNGVPSLHMTWALLIWLNTRSVSRWARFAALAFALATAFDTLASGEHYLFDLVVALPFTLSMQALMIRTVSIRARQRWLPIVCGSLLFLFWLVIGRFGIQIVMTNRALSWFLLASSSTVSIAWALKLPPMIPEMQTKGIPKTGDVNLGWSPNHEHSEVAP